MTPWQLDPKLADGSHPVAHLSLSELRLMDDATYPWLLLIPRVCEATELIDLDAAQQAMLMTEINRCSRIAKKLFLPTKLNVAALGNVVPQLHVHVIARFANDPAWPAPVWGRIEAAPYSPEALVERVARLQGALAE